MMIEIDFDKPCTLSSLAFATSGLRIDTLHLVVQAWLRKHDKYAVLEKIDQLIEKVRTIPSYGKIESYSNPEITAEEAEMKLDDLRRWFITSYCYDEMENCNKVVELRQALAEKEKGMARLDEEMRQREKGWEAEKKGMEARMEEMKQKEEWAKRVTYEAVVEQIAACEDAKERDEARKLIEPLLKREMARKFRADIKKKVKEMSEAPAPTTVNVHAGGINIQHVDSVRK